MLTRRLILLAAVAAWAAPAARADVKPHPLFTDHMVLQQGTQCPVWGLADPGEEVTVSVAGKAGRGIAAKTTADDKGRWKAALPGLPAGTGVTLTIKGKNTVILSNVAVGDVWVCSGQ